MVTLSKLLSTEITQQKLSKQLYNTWVDLLDVRHKTGYSSTPVNVSIGGIYASLPFLCLSYFVFLNFNICLHPTACGSQGGRAECDR